MHHRKSIAWFWLLCAVHFLSACGGKNAEVVSDPSPSAGQVTPAVTTNQVSVYAASRFAEQATFGPTPALVAEIRQKGFEKWIDDQFALPATLINTAPFTTFVDPTPKSEHIAGQIAFPNIAISANDQLRARATWSIGQFIVTSDRKGDRAGAVSWVNLLQNYSLSNYSSLLVAITRHPHMAHYLDNDQNRPKSSECPNCAPNENFAREIMQLFSIGVFMLNTDGTPVRDTKGNLVETYSQKDVEELARVFTGWEPDNVPKDRPGRNWHNWFKPMVPTTWPPLRDSGTKTVLGRNFSGGQSQEKDLSDAVEMLMAHPNIAPFVAQRMIQHLVKSNPTPQYVGRVAAKFRNNGEGVVGDMKAVVKAVLLDSEARVGDNPATSRADDGKFREPFLHHMALWRGLGCRSIPVNFWGAVQSQNQPAFSPESVFSFYAPTDRAPGSNLLAPEQKLVNANELTSRLSLIHGARWDHFTQQHTMSILTDVGCKIEPLVAAYSVSSRAYNDYLSERFFRGSMPPTLRSNIDQLIREPQWDTKDPAEGTLRMLDFALTSPYFGVIK